MADNTKWVQAQTFSLGGAGVTASATSIDLQSFKTPDGTTITMTDLGDIGYMTLEPGTTREEIISFTGVTQNADGSAQLTTVSRGLNFRDPYTADSSRQKSHAGGTTAVLTNNPQLFAQLAAKDNDETITETWTFTAPNIPRQSDSSAPTDDEEYANKKYVDDTAIAGAPDATQTVKGIVEIATDTELSTGAAAGSGDTSADLVAHAASFNETAAAGKVPVAESTGQIGEDWLGLSTAGDLLYTDGTDLQRLAIGSAGQFLKVNSGATAPEWGGGSQVFGGDGSDGALDTSGGTVDIDAGGARFVVKNYTSINVASNPLTFSNTNANGTVFILKSQGNVTISDTINLDGDGAAGGDAGTNGNAGSDGTPASNWAIYTQDGTNIEGQGGQANDPVSAEPGGVQQFSPPGHNISIMTLQPGSGGGGGGSGDGATTSGAGGDGGDGGGALMIECNGALNFTGTITADGTKGADGNTGTPSNAGGGGGGGAGGAVLILYNTLTSKSGTITIEGGDGGDAQSGTDGGSSNGGGGSGGGSPVSRGGDGGEVNTKGEDAPIGGSGGADPGGNTSGGGGGGASGWYAILPYIDPETT